MKIPVAFAAVLVSSAALAASSSAGAILRILNLPDSGSPNSYREAKAEILADARQGRPVQAFLYGAIFPEDPESKGFLEKSRAKIHMLAEEKNNALAWYLLSLENQDLTCLKKAADGKNVQALNAWATIMINEATTAKDMDQDDREKLLKKGFEAYKQAAEMKDPNGLYNLGTCYMAGIGCARDGILGLAAFQSAAELGHPEAINNIGGCYRDGLVVDKDPALAAKWFKKSSDLGNPYGQLNYALCLLNGEGVSKDPEAGAELLETAANGGNMEAMECLATCFEKGVGVKEDAHLAMIWTIRARAARGSKSAQDWLEKNGCK